MGGGAPSPDRNVPDLETYGLAIVLAALAGWVDVVTFIRFHGLFVSFVSGNSTQGAVEAMHDWRQAVLPALAVLVFLAGVVLGELLAPPGGRWARPLVLAVEAALLWSAVALRGDGAPVVTSLLGLAMGLQNASVHHVGGISVALTYVTGTVVHIGRALAKALRGEASWRQALPYLGLWMGLLAGGIGGAAVARQSYVAALIVAAVVASGLAIWTAAGVRRAAM